MFLTLKRGRINSRLVEHGFEYVDANHLLAVPRKGKSHATDRTDDPRNQANNVSYVLAEGVEELGMSVISVKRSARYRGLVRTQ